MRNYNFYITIGETTTQVTPRYESMVRQWRRQDGEIFHRIELDVTLKFQRADYDLIMNAPFDTEYLIKVYEVIDGSDVLYFPGKFRRTDLEVNEDDKTVTLKPDPDDRYESVMSAKDKEYDLFDIGVAVTPVTYVKQPLIQVYIPNAEYITNYLGSIVFETPVTEPIELTSEIENTYKFSLGKAFTYVIGDSTVLDPDVSGEYDNTTGQRTDGQYQLTSINLGGGNTQWVIRDVDAPQTIRYEAPVNEFPFPSDQSPFDPQTEFTSVTDSNVKCKASRFLVYVRYLTDLSEVNSVSTFPMPSPDIVSTDFGYDYVIGLATSNFVPYSGNQETPTKYGKIRDTASNFAGSYFKQLTPAPSSGISDVEPVNATEWKEFSLWFYYDTLLRQLQEDGARVYTTESAFKIADVLSALLGVIDPDITHQESTDYSEFLYDSSNPITGSSQRYLVITPKSNVVVGDYDQPAQKATIKLSEIINLLRFAYNLWWYIDDSNRLIFEHYRYFNNGKSYSSAQTTFDTTTQLESRTGKAWSYKSNNYKFEKGDIPEQIRLKWMDEVSTPFEGYPINTVSNYAQKGNIEERNISLFTSDVDFIQSQPNEINKNGFVLFECVLSGSDYTVPFVEVTVASDESYKMQNGHASWVYLADNYHRDGLPTNSVTINEQSISANSVLRKKIQELTFPMPESFDELQLVETGLGGAQIVEIDEDSTYKIAQFKLAHETE